MARSSVYELATTGRLLAVAVAACAAAPPPAPPCPAAGKLAAPVVCRAVRPTLDGKRGPPGRFGSVASSTPFNAAMWPTSPPSTGSGFEELSLSWYFLR